MAFEILVGLQVKNDQMYNAYREHMMPILVQYGGGFRYDFKVSEVLKNEEGRPINRVFVIYFKDQKSRDEFFNHPEYIKVKEKYFVDAVESRTLIAEYNR